MEIIKGNLVSRCFDVKEIPNYSSVIDITDSLDNYDYDFLKSLDISEGTEVKAVKRIFENNNEVYCFIVQNIKIGKDNKTKAIIIEKIIIDNNAICEDFFNWMIEIIFKQKHDFYDRLIIGNKNVRLGYYSNKTIKEVSNYLLSLFKTNVTFKTITINNCFY